MHLRILGKIPREATGKARTKAQQANNLKILVIITSYDKCMHILFRH